MEKIKLNNQIVLMRKYVKQAKVHVINRLVKEIKLLQNRKGNEVQVLKAKRKAERFLEEIALLKKIKPDQVSKLALSKTSSWDEVLQQKNSTLNDRCIAMLASYKAVQKEVKAFQSSNKDLVLKISELIKQWDEKNKYSNTSPKSKIEKGNGRKEKNTDRNMLNNSKNKTDIPKTNIQLVNEEEKRIENMNEYTNKRGKQNKFSVDSSQNSVPDVIQNTTDAVKTTCQEEADGLENIPRKENLKKNTIGVGNSNIYEDSENEDIAEEFSSTTNIHKSDLKGNKMEIIDSDVSEESDEEDQNKIKISENENNIKNIPKKENLKKNIIGDGNSNIFEDSENEDIVEEFSTTANIHKSDLEGNKMEIISSDVSEESDEGDSKNVSGETRNQKKNKISENENNIKTNSFKELERNKMEITDSDSNEESEQEDSESEDNGIESHQESSENKNIKLEQSNSSELIRKNNNNTNISKNKLKTIALLNLDELEGLEEIPLRSKAEKDSSGESEIESSEDEASETSYNRRNDPFFLGCSDEASVADIKLDSFPKNKDNFPSYSKKAPNRESNSFFQRKGNFQRFSNEIHLNRKDRRKLQRDNFKPFQDIQPTTRNYQGKFQSRNKNVFNRNNSKSQEDFKTKGKAFQNYKEKGREDSSKCIKINGDKFSGKHLDYKKGNTSDKPLHPSWEAKRKQKELINTSFQGKRMVFDD